MLKPFLRGLLFVLLIAGGGLYLNSSASLQEITLFGEITPFLKGGEGDFVQQPDDQQPDTQQEDDTNLTATEDLIDNSDFLAPGQGDSGEAAGGYIAEISPLEESFTTLAASLTGSHLFITTWDTRNTSTGSTNESTLKIPTLGAGYSGEVDRGDGVVEIFTGTAPTIQHIYPTAGVYQVSIQGKFPRIYFNNEGDRNKILSVDQWGAIEWTNMQSAFHGCENMQILASDAPDLSKVEDMGGMFMGTKFNDNINHWDISNVTSIYMLFQYNDVYNQPLNNWNTSNIKNMHQVFQSAPAFNQPLDNRDTSQVTMMRSMFNNAKSFNQNINNRDTSNVTDMHGMFANTDDFNQPLDNWKTSKVTTMSFMFQDAKSFNQPLDNWDVSKVTNMSYTFVNTDNFNQPLDNWNTSQVTTMLQMFQNAKSFNQPLDKWDVSKVTTMNNMFAGAINFNGSLSGWNTASLTGNGMISMFENATSFNQPVNHFKVENITSLRNVFYKASVFNQPLDNWNTSKVTDMLQTFGEASNFNQPIDNRDTSSVESFNTTFASASSFNQPLNSRNTTSATTMTNMFNSATNFNQPLNNRNTSKVTTMSTMFAYTNFNQDISNWDTSEVTVMRRMFKGTPNFNQNISNRDTSKVEQIYEMFFGASKFNQDLSNWDVSAVGFTGPDNISFAGMFSGAGLSVYNYNQILSGWSSQNLASGHLLGAQGISYGGCNLANREEGITGREKLIADKGRTITDAGLADCVPVPSYGGGGGGGVALQKDDCPNGDFSPSYYDGTCGNKISEDGNQKISEDTTFTTENGIQESSDNLQKESSEILLAYDWAFSQGITTLSPIEDANLTGPLLRSHLAKMVVNYVAITPSSVASLLPLPLSGEENKEFPIFLSRSTAGVAEGGGAINAEGAINHCTFTDLTTTTNELQTYITLACQLGLMGIHSDGTPLSDFMPNKKVTRAEFGTVLSRLLYGTTYNNGTPYYLNHLQTLKEHGIMTQITNPEKQIERRQRVRLMLMRASKQE